MNKRVLFTGGSGKAGKHATEYLVAQDHRVLNVDLVPLEFEGVKTLNADITDSDQMFNAMTSYAGWDEMEMGTGAPNFDAVVHFAAVPRILISHDNETFRVKTIEAYNVIESAVKSFLSRRAKSGHSTSNGEWQKSPLCSHPGRRNTAPCANGRSGEAAPQPKPCCSRSGMGRKWHPSIWGGKWKFAARII